VTSVVLRQKMNGLMGFRQLRVQVLCLQSQIRCGSTIQVLLLENVVNRGVKGEVVKVSPVTASLSPDDVGQVKRGHFRNLLYPRKLAG
jgi:hypothetical protein